MLSFSLRFQGSEEASFKKSVQPQLVMGYLCFSATIIAFLFATFLPVYIAESSRADCPFRWGAVDDPRHFFFGISISVSVLFMLGACSCLCWLRGCIQWFDFEAFALASMLALVASAFSCSPWHVAEAFGKSSAEVWALHAEHSDSEAMGILQIVAAVVAMCEFIPIRAHLSWLVPCVASVVYPTVTWFVGTQAPYATAKANVLFAMICVIAHCGSWRHELERRAQWRAMREASEHDLVARGMEAMSWVSCDVVLRLGADGHVVDANHIQDAFFGQAMHGRKISDFIAQDDQDWFRSTLENAASMREAQSMPATFQLKFTRLRVRLTVVWVDGASIRYLVGVSQVDARVSQEEQTLENLHPIDEEDNNEIRSKLTCPPKFGSGSGEGDHIPEGVSMLASSPTDRVFGDIERLCTGLTGQASLIMRRNLENISKIGVREHWLVGTADIDVLQPPVVLGMGGFGWVALGRFHGAPVAIKVPRMQGARSNPKQIACFCNEIRLLRRVRHSHIVAFHGAAIDPETGELAMIFEYVQGANMGDYVRQVHFEKRAAAVEATLTTLLLDVSCALTYLHELVPLIVHGDVKDTNIKVFFSENERARAKLLDFGLSRLLTRRAKPLGGTKQWMAPEVLMRNAVHMHPASSTDVFSFGLLAHFTMTGVDVAESFDGTDAHGRFERLSWPEGTPRLAEAEDLCRDCLQVQPLKRPRMPDIMKALKIWLVRSGAPFEDLGQSVVCLLAHVASWDTGMRVLRSRMAELELSPRRSPSHQGAGASNGLPDCMR